MSDWMIADGVPEIAQARRLGHLLGDKIQQAYSHLAAEVEARLLTGLTDRWADAVTANPHEPPWRHNACAAHIAEAGTSGLIGAASWSRFPGAEHEPSRLAARHCLARVASFVRSSWRGGRWDRMCPRAGGRTT